MDIFFFKDITSAAKIWVSLIKDKKQTGLALFGFLPASCAHCPCLCLRLVEDSFPLN